MLGQYRIIIPSEHGSWSLMLTPFVIGVGIGSVATGRFYAAGAFLCALAVLATFLARQPLTLWFRVKRGRARASDGRPALFWSAVLLGISGGAVMGLALLDRVEILWLALPVLVILIATIGLAARVGSRHLSVELTGVTGMALAAPAGYMSITGGLDEMAGYAWVIAGLHNIVSILYVRLRIDQLHDRETNRFAGITTAAHLIAVILIIILIVAKSLSWVLPVLFGVLLSRVVYVVMKKPPLTNVKRFGFSEMGLALLFACFVIYSFGG